MSEIWAILSAPPMFWILMALVGLVFGGFATVAADRLGRAASVMDGLSEILAEWQAHLWAKKRQEKGVRPPKQAPEVAIEEQLLAQAPEDGIWSPASRCDQCGRALSLLEKLPLIGFFVTGGRCPACGYRVPWLLPAAEAMVAVGVGALAFWLGPAFAFWPAAVFVWFLVALGLADLLHRRLPDALVFPLMWTGLLAAALGLWPLDPAQAVLGAAVGFVGLMALSWLMETVAGRFMIGGGDVAFIGALGAWLGWERLIVAIGLAAVLALIQASARGILGHADWRQTPFGPALAVAAAVMALTVLGLWQAPGVVVVGP